MPIQGKMTPAPGGNYLVGMVAHPEKPSDIHRTRGSVPQYFGLNGIIDEIKVAYTAKTAGEVENDFNGYQITSPDIQPHRLPDIENHPGRFGAFYTKLKYYDGWDNLWPVDQDPDIVVCFDKLPVKVMFWRGVRYGASWVAENNNWMTDQSVEAWNNEEGCFEHMQDRHCRFSHVRVIENTDARVVVHWRYAPVSAHDNTWRIDPKTGWECWVDEYHYIYPDASGIRKVSWKKETLQYPRQFQESLPLLNPGQVQSDLLHKDYVHISNYEGNIAPVSYVDNPGSMDREFARDYTVQQYNFKSDNKPFICFEPGNQMNLRYGNIDNYNEHASCNHFPVGQARCDGRTSTSTNSDRPSHFGGFPISYPVIHEKGDRRYWNGLYGINDMEMKEVVELGKSWAFAPELILKGNDFESKGYDLSERCFKLESKNNKSLEFELKGSKDNPIVNPAFIIESWAGENAEVLVDGNPAKDARIGINHELDGNDLVIFLFLEEKKPVTLSIR